MSIRVVDSEDGPPCMSGCGCLPWKIIQGCTCPDCAVMRDYWDSLDPDLRLRTQELWLMEWHERLAGAKRERV